jgi:hypothetical protein
MMMWVDGVVGGIFGLVGSFSHHFPLFLPSPKNIPQNYSSGIFGRADALTARHVTASSPFTKRRTKKQNRKATLLSKTTKQIFFSFYE